MYSLFLINVPAKYVYLLVLPQFSFSTSPIRVCFFCHFIRDTGIVPIYPFIVARVFVYVQVVGLPKLFLVKSVAVVFAESFGRKGRQSLAWSLVQLLC